MNAVRVFAARTSSCGVTTDAWRDITHVIGGHLKKIFGDSVCVEYIDTFGPEMSGHAAVASRIAQESLQLPVIYIDEELFTSGDKINGPALRKEIEQLQQKPRAGSTRVGVLPPELGKAVADHLLTIEPLALSRQG